MSTPGGREPQDDKAAELREDVWRAAYEAYRAGDTVGVGVIEKRRLRLAIQAALRVALPPPGSTSDVDAAWDRLWEAARQLVGFFDRREIATPTVQALNAVEALRSELARLDGGTPKQEEGETR